jgi:hypothetical protein
MEQVLRCRIRVWLVVAGVLALWTALVAPGGGIVAAATQGRIAVVAYPDLSGEQSAGRDCPGCDGAFTDADTEANADAPLPSLDVILRDEGGDEVERNATSGLANGRQVTFFTVASPGKFELELGALPEPWALCPDAEMQRTIGADDFDATTGIATVEFYVWRSCKAAAAPTATEAATAETMPAGSTATEGAAAPVTSPSATSLPPTATEAPTEAMAAAATTPTAKAPLSLGAIRGLVFVDLDGDGRAGPAEAGVPGVTVRLAGDDDASAEEVSGVAGTFEFKGLVAGDYDLSVAVPAGYRVTTPDRYAGVAVHEDIVMGLDFGLAGPADAAAPAAPATTGDTGGPGSLPGTGVQLHSTGGLFLGLAALIGAFGAFGLAVEHHLGRRSLPSGKGR